MESKLLAQKKKNEELNASIIKLKADALKQANDTVEVSCLKEALKASTEKNSRMANEIAVMRALAKGNGVTEEQINAQLAKITGT